MYKGSGMAVCEAMEVKICQAGGRKEEEGGGPQGECMGCGLFLLDGRQGRALRGSSGAEIPMPVYLSFFAVAASAARAALHGAQTLPAAHLHVDKLGSRQVGRR